MRVKKGFKARRRRNRVLKLAKGFRGRRKNCYKRANQAVERALDYATRDRAPEEARLPRALDRPHQRRGPAQRADLLAADRRPDQGQVALDRKVLADLAVADPAGFAAVANLAAA